MHRREQKLISKVNVPLEIMKNDMLLGPGRIFQEDTSRIKQMSLPFII